MPDPILKGRVEESATHVDLEQRFSGAQPAAKESAPQTPEKEPVSEVAAAEKAATYGKMLSTVQEKAQPSDDVQITQDVRDIQEMDHESQIVHLIDIALTESVERAVKIAQKADDYYILDQLHDRLLSDELHEALVARGLVEL